MELRRYLILLRKWGWLILLTAVVAGLATFLVTRVQQPIYRSTATLLVNEGRESAADQYNSILTSERLALSYVQRLSNYEVLEEAIARVGLTLDPKDLEESMTISLLGNTNLITLAVDHPNPEIASRLANEIPAVFATRNLEQQLERYNSSKSNLERELAELQKDIASVEQELAQARELGRPNQTQTDDLNSNLARLKDAYSTLVQSYEEVRIAEAGNLTNIIIDEPARPASEPIRPRVGLNTAVASVAGILLALGVALVSDYLDDKVKSPQEVERILGINPLGAIKQIKVTNPVDVLVVAHAPRSPAAEAYRQIRTNIQFTSVDRELKILLVTSANIGEGKTTTASNLAISLAQSGKRVILVDADMRRPMTHVFLEASGARGLSDMIIRGRQHESFLQATLITNLRLLPAGKIPPNPAELLGSERMREVTVWLREQADYIIFDSPPILAVTDAAVLSQLVDTTLIVASTTQTRYPALAAAVQQIAALESHIAGVIVNKAPAHNHNGYYSYYAPPSYPSTYDEAGPKSWRERLQGLSFSGD